MYSLIHSENRVFSAKFLRQEYEFFYYFYYNKFAFKLSYRCTNWSTLCSWSHSYSTEVFSVFFKILNFTSKFVGKYKIDKRRTWKGEISNKWKDRRERCDSYLWKVCRLSWSVDRIENEKKKNWIFQSPERIFSFRLFFDDEIQVFFSSSRLSTLCGSLQTFLRLVAQLSLLIIELLCGFK